MPTYLRNFYYKQLVKIKEEETKEIKKSQRKSKVPKPTINPRFKR